MRNKLKGISTGLYILLVAFSNAVYFLIITALDMSRNQILYRSYYLAIALSAVLYFGFKIRRIPVRAIIASISMLMFLMICYLATRFFYPYSNSLYESMTLVVFANIIPTILVGTAMIVDGQVLVKIEKALPLFLLFFTIVLLRVVLFANVGVNVGQTYETESGLNYQTISYYSIFSYGFAMYLVRYGNHTLFLRIFFLAIAIVDLIMCLMCGGRGAFVLSLVLTLYLFGGKLSFSSLFLFLTFAALLVVLFFRIQDNELFEMGTSRLFDFFSSKDAFSNDIRWERWRIAWKSFQASPIIGHGIGSVFYEVGMYSHNIFTDLLVEGGFLLVTLFIADLIKFLKRLRNFVRNNYRYRIVFIMFLCEFVKLCFSGYYLTDSMMWIALAFVFSQRCLSGSLLKLSNHE